jgi:radical SAM superfamily enzyme YgiQ (UPF0313 family)
MSLAVLISTYEMGRQPFGLASPAAWLRAAGWEVVCVDWGRRRYRDDDENDVRVENVLARAELIGFHLPMHTATRLAAPLITRARRTNRTARLCAYGVYAPLNEEWLKSLGVDAVFGGEFEEDLREFACGDGRAPRTPDTDIALSTPADDGAQSSRRTQGNKKDFSANSASSARDHRASSARGRVTLPRIQFLVPDRTGLPPLSKYATLQLPDGTRRLVGYTEATRGCRHLCRHCPIVPVYNGQFRVVQANVVLADIDTQIAAGAQHITFGDPDFFNGPTHAMRIVESLHARHPDVSYDVTIKVEHLLQHRDLLPRLAATGCAFVTSAVESIDDRVLAILDKGHTRAGFIEAVRLCRAAGVTLVPTFVTFHPWMTLAGYCDLLDTIDELDLVDHVAPIQLAIRLLVPEGSRLLELDEMRRHIGAFDPVTLTYRWSHPDPRVDSLHAEVSQMVGACLTADRRVMFDAISARAHECAGLPWNSHKPARDRATVPYLNEPWYC